MTSILRLVLIYGPAGSGKTTFTWKFSEWAQDNVEAKIAAVNMDPAVLYIPYQALFDIRKFVTAKELMEKHGLGPNGAIMGAVEESERYLDKLFQNVDAENYDYVLIDTPGIMEVFVGRKIGRRIVDKLLDKYVVIGIFIMDASAVNVPSEYVYFKSLYVLSGLRLGIPSIPVWNKISIATSLFREIDVLEPNDIKKKLYSEPGLYTDVAIELFGITRKMESAVKFLKIDSLSNLCFSELYDILHEIFCTCGDLT